MCLNRRTSVRTLSRKSTAPCWSSCSLKYTIERTPNDVQTNRPGMDHVPTSADSLAGMRLRTRANMSPDLGFTVIAVEPTRGTVRSEVAFNKRSRSKRSKGGTIESTTVVLDKQSTQDHAEGVWRDDFALLRASALAQTPGFVLLWPRSTHRQELRSTASWVIPVPCSLTHSTIISDSLITPAKKHRSSWATAEKPPLCLRTLSDERGLSRR